MKDINKKIEIKLLLTFLENVPFEGWKWETLYDSAFEIKLLKSKKISDNDKLVLKNLFDNDLLNIIIKFNDYLDLEMKESFRKSKYTNEKIPSKIKHQILFRLKAATKYREAVRVSIGIMALPQNSRLALSMLYKTCDIIWRNCGDRSTDFSFYTKRLILSGVYSSTLSYWLNEKDFVKVEHFLQRRLNNVSKFGELKKIPKLINQSNPINTIMKIFQKFSSKKFSYK